MTLKYLVTELAPDGEPPSVNKVYRFIMSCLRAFFLGGIGGVLIVWLNLFSVFLFCFCAVW